MKYFFDESGQFAVKVSGPHSLIGIMYPDVFENKLLSFYNEFTKTLSSSEFKNGEPKGCLLKTKSRENLFAYLADNSWLRIAVSLTDSEFNSENQIQQYRNEQTQIYMDNLTNPDYKTKKTELYNLIDDMKVGSGINDVLIIKGLLLVHNFCDLFIHSLNYFTADVYDDSWKNIELYFDRQNKDKITRIEKWVQKVFKDIVGNYSLNNPIELEPEWFSRNHPFLTDNYNVNDEKLLLDDIFKNEFKFPDSKLYFQLQITDWISNTLFLVFKNELSKKYIDSISSNLVKNNQANFNLVCLNNTDKQALYHKYEKLLL